MRNWNTDKIIGAGLIVALFLIVIADLAIAIANGDIRSTELPGNIVSGLIGYIGRGFIGKNDNKTS